MPHRGDFFEPLNYFEAPPVDGETKKGPNSDWAFDHKADVAAHHAKYTDAEAKAVAGNMPLVLHPSEFVPENDTQDWEFSYSKLKNRAALTAQNYYAPVKLPHGATVTKLTLFGYKDNASATMQIILRSVDRTGGYGSMASVVADWTSGESSGYDDVINDPIIDNTLYSYVIRLTLDPSAAVTEISLTTVVIDWM